MSFLKNLRRSAKQPAGKTLAAERRSMLSEHTPFGVTEAYKAARTNLMYLPITDKCRRIAVTSGFASEGKTTNTINLAISIAQSGQKVLLIDADLRKPRLSRMFGATQTQGLSEVLAGIAEESTLISEVRENLSLIGSGKIPVNPAELLASPRMDALVQRLSERFDYILIDTSPVNVVTDALLLTNSVHGFLVSVLAERSDVPGVRGAIAKLQQLNANIFGFVLGNVNTKSTGYGGKYGEYGEYVQVITNDGVD